MLNIISTRYKARYDTLANWTQANPILLQGEMAVIKDEDAIRVKIGDGIVAFNDLPYITTNIEGIAEWAKAATPGDAILIELEEGPKLTNGEKVVTDVHWDTTKSKLIIRKQALPDALDISGKADKAATPVADNLASLTAEGNLKNSGESVESLKTYARDQATAAETNAKTYAENQINLAETAFVQAIGAEANSRAAADEALGQNIDAVSGSVSALNQTVNNINQTVNAHTMQLGGLTSTVGTQGVAIQTITDVVVPGLAPKAAAGNKLVLTIDPTTFVLTASLKNINGEIIVGSEATIDLPLESMVVSGSYDPITKTVNLVLQSGQVVSFSVADLIDGLVNQTDFEEHTQNDIRHIDATKQGILNKANALPLQKGEADGSVKQIAATPSEINGDVVDAETYGLNSTAFGTAIQSAIDYINTIGGFTLENFDAVGEVESEAELPTEDVEHGTIYRVVDEEENINDLYIALVTKDPETEEITDVTWEALADYIYELWDGVDPDKFALALGENSFVAGHNCIALRKNASAEGNGCAATNNSAFARGTGAKALGKYSTAEGLECVSEQSYAHSEGRQTNATGKGAHSEGDKTEASGEFSHSEGYQTVASGKYATSEGQETVSEGRAAHAEGKDTFASGTNSHSEGEGTQATERNAHAEGENTQATNRAAHSEGIDTQATGQHAHAEGAGGIASGNNSHSEGWHETGVGSATGGASHAEGDSTLASGYAAHAEGQSCQALATGAHSEGLDCYAVANGAHSEGYYTVARLQATHAEGLNTIAGEVPASYELYDSGKTYSAGAYVRNTDGYIYKCIKKGKQPLTNSTYWVEMGGAHAEGTNTQALGLQSHTEGYSTKATGESAHAEGDKTQATGGHSHIEGSGGIASGTNSHTEGWHDEDVAASIGGASHAEGDSTIAKGYASHAEGEGTIAAAENGQHAAGKWNVETSGARVTGKGTDNAHRSNAEVLDWNGNLSLAGNLTLDMNGTSATLTAQMIRDIGNIGAVLDAINGEVI